MYNERMVRIEWRDAQLHSGTTYTKEECKDLKMSKFSSLGFLVGQDKETTILAAEQDDDGDYRDISLIPTTSIISIRPLVLGDQDKSKGK